tara:strand:+ start:1012 stop:1779 length:768 start_codon:yes stop_codon:yes gene_type:complete
MSWFNILKNEMRSVNLPKFKVKPFNVNKPDEDDNCERKVKEIERRFYARKFFNQSEISSLEEKLKNPDFEVNTNVHKHTDNRRRLTIRYTPKPEKYPNYNQDDSLTISVVVDHETWQTTFGKDSTAQTFADSKLSEEDYCTVLDAIQRDVPFTSKDGAIRYFHTDALTRTANDNDGTFDNVESFSRLRGLIVNRKKLIRMDIELDVNIEYRGKLHHLTYNDNIFLPNTLETSSQVKDGLDIIADYINNINIKFTE